MSKTNSIKRNCHRMGLGFDSHAFGTNGRLMLGGVRFTGLPALAGHSDGDALLHAVIDALLGGTSAGDIGEFFPDTSDKWKGASSLKMLKLALQRVRAHGSRVHHLDITVVANKPRLAPVKLKLRRSVAKAIGLPVGSVNLKGKTQEGLTWFKESGGIAVWAIATLSPTEKN